ncbi:MAG: hypothetical protein Q7K57_34705 [Burkholderiaceae bacterium]|nr:hypothetical protein [Burkholderiaceae bacterium]
MSIFGKIGPISPDQVFDSVTDGQRYPRGKDNETGRLELRLVAESAAEMAVHAVGFVLREIDRAMD